MAEGTPRKRSRDPDSSCSAFQTPVPKRFRGFPSPSRKSRDKLFASQIQWSPSSDEEIKENKAFPGKAAHSRKLEISLVPTAGKRESPGKSQKSHVPLGVFYGKGGTYLDPLERKRLRELQGSGDGNGAGNLLEKNRNSRNSSRNPSRNRSSKGKTKPRRDHHSVPKGGKEKGAIPEGKENGNSGNCVVRKKVEWPLRVLSMGVRPALRLPLGSAFFSSGKRSHSRKNPRDPKSGGRTTQGTAPEKLEKSGSAGKSETVEGKGTLGRILEHREEEKENREESVGFGNLGEAAQGGKAPEKSGNGSGDPEAGAAGSSAEENEESRNSLTIPSPSPSKEKKDLGSPSQAGLYPIFIPGSGSRRRPLDEPSSPFGISPSGKASPSSQKSRKTKELSQNSQDQLIIDAGQKQWGAQQCPSCGMLYAPDSPEDRLQHLRYHQRLQEGLRYLGWKKERVVAEFWDGKIVLILPEDPKYAVRKAEEVRQIVDTELGFQPVPLQCPHQTRIYLFVSARKSVLGCLVAEGISQAFRVLSEPFPDSQDSRDSQDSARAWRCSLDPEPAVCGISRIWVLQTHRHRGIARRMVDVLRRTFLFGTVLDSRDLAFSDPTPDGRAFASRYCGVPNFLVYNFLHNGSGSSGSSGSGSSGS